MKKKQSILFITPYPKGKAPSQRFRFEQYLDFLALDFSIEEHAFWDNKSWDNLYKGSNLILKIYSFIFAFFKRFLLLFSVSKFDYIFIHREATPVGPPFVEFIIAKVLNKKIIYDFDDAIWIHNVSDKNKAVKYLKSNWKVKYICKWSYKVVCGNHFLASYAQKQNKNVVVIPTTIDLNYHKKPIVSKPVKTTIGWTGTHSTLKHLNIIIPIIEKLEEKFDFDFIIISDKKPNFKLKSLKFIKWTKETEIEDLAKIDIGIMPLYDSEWEKGKCGFKGLQYMSLAIPTVMSPVGVNTEIITTNVNGFLAQSEQEWVAILSELIEDQELRSRIGKAGEKTIKFNYSVKANQLKFLGLFKELFSL